MNKRACSTVLSNPDEYEIAKRTLEIWRNHGRVEASHLFKYLTKSNTNYFQPGILLQELNLRLRKQPGPRVLVDGLWFSRPYGGISRVWETILQCWSLQDLVTDQAPVSIIDRNSHIAVTARFNSFPGKDINPLNIHDIQQVAEEASYLCNSWGANVFISSWISTIKTDITETKQLALIHDCMPERSKPDKLLLAQRQNWIQNASQYLAVSEATAQDVKRLLGNKKKEIPWCHPGIDDRFCNDISEQKLILIWKKLSIKYQLPPRFILLPATSKIGSYKNPELAVKALTDPRLTSVGLMLSGLGAQKHRDEIIRFCPSIAGRCIAVNLSEIELKACYKQALAVVIPSRIEGFGLPAIEAMASGGIVVVANSRGLKESGGEAALRCHPEDPENLADLLDMLNSKDARDWIVNVIRRRSISRMKRLSPEIFGLALLALARQI